MLGSLFSLLLLFLPGYSLLSLEPVNKRLGFKTIDRILFGAICWIFYVVTTTVITRIIAPHLVNETLWVNYILGSVLLGFGAFSTFKRFLKKDVSLHFNLQRITFGGTLPFLVPVLIFTVIITLYTPLIYQWDALGSYLLLGRQLVAEVPSGGGFPSFGDCMPVVPVLYAWFFLLSDTPILRFVPLLIFLWTILVVYALGRKLFPENPHVSYISIVSLASMGSLQWYMAKTSLYPDLLFIFLSACSIYTLIHTREKQTNQVIYLMLGINLALVCLSKQFGVAQVWFVMAVLLSTWFRKRLNSRIWALGVGTFLVAPLIVYYFGLGFVFGLLEGARVSTIYKSLILAAFLPLLFFSALKLRNLQGPRLRGYRIAIIVIPLLLPTLFSVHNFFSIGVPFGFMKAPYIQRISDLGMTFSINTKSSIPSPSLQDLFLKLKDPFLINTFMTTNLVPFLASTSALFLSKSKRLSNNSYLLLAWFFYWLFIFYFQFLPEPLMNYARRRLLLMAIPLSLMVGHGVQRLTSNSWPSWVGTLTYTSITSASLAYLWFFRLDRSQWWLRNLTSLISSTAKANLLEVFFYCLPWVLLIFLARLKRITFITRYPPKVRVYSEKINRSIDGWSIVSMTLLIVLAIAPMMLVNYATRFPERWDPAYYDEADSVKMYSDHGFTPPIDFYCSQLDESDSVSITFGTAPIRYFSNHTFIDLNHPRNWLIHLPLVRSDSVVDLVTYLQRSNIRYFLIPNEVRPERARYEGALETSTLFNLIEASAVVTTNDGQVFKFEKLAEFIPVDLYALTPLPTPSG